MLLCRLKGIDKNMNNVKNDEPKIYYEYNLANLYDYLPTFGVWKRKNLDFINKPFMEGAKLTDGRVLEFATATGMLTIPLARMGYKVTSLDISPYMHDIVRDKLKNEEQYVSENITLIRQDCVKYCADEPFDMIAIPDGMFIALENQERQMECLRSCNRNLRKGGRLYFDIAKPVSIAMSHPECLYKSGNYITYKRFRDKDGIPFIITLNTSIEPWEQRCDLKYEFKEYQGEKVYPDIDISYRYVHYGELVLMLEQNGFRVINIDTDFFFGRYFFVTAEKK